MSPLETALERRVFSVSDLTRNIRALLEENFPRVWVEGEICNYKHHTSGHRYFSIKDEEAQLGCVLFRREGEQTGFELGDGLKVICGGRISVYSPRGQYQFYVEKIEPKGVGALQLRYQELLKKLRQEGLFDDVHKKELPYLPRRIAVVTSIDGAALRDILKVLDRRFPDVHVLIYPVAVQGNAAAPEIAEAIDDLNRFEAADVMIVGRGGGSLEDLWAFNEEIVARAIFASRIPVISAVGHEVDFTISDFVADFRAPTPSAAAEIVLPRKEDLLLRLEELKARSVQSIYGVLKSGREDFERLGQSRVLKDPLRFLETQRQRLDELKRSIGALLATSVRFKTEAVASLSARLEALGPLEVLRRGFSVSLKLPQEKVILSHADVRPGDLIKTKLRKGFFISQVKETQA